MTHYIGNAWMNGEGEAFSSLNPATQEVIWEGREASESQVNLAIQAALSAFPLWQRLSFEKRFEYLKLFQKEIEKAKKEIALSLSKDTGKPLWESLTEVESMIKKVDFTERAFQERCSSKLIEEKATFLKKRYKAHGVVAVFGPFNLPLHLPHGHILPALLAGNTVILKPSEFTPYVTHEILKIWEKVGLPKGVLNMIQGGHKTGKFLASHPQLSGLFFTGSYRAGLFLSDLFAKHPEKILALEMGGNNPLIMDSASDLEGAAYTTLLSAYITTGQRCSCARRLILVENAESKKFLNVLIEMASKIQIGPFSENPEPFMGPLIHLESAKKLLGDQQKLVAEGGTPLLEMRQLDVKKPFLTPGLIDVTNSKERRDEEFFGPLLQLIRVPSFEEAIVEANKTEFGLTAGLLSKSKEKYLQFFENVHAGIINWNMPTTGASSLLPFGGVGKSGNNRPSGYFAADYCSYPVSSMEVEKVTFPEKPLPGIHTL